jgi:hypothetical protein
MKTEDDLLEAVVRYSLEGTGASEGQIDLMIHRFRTQLLAKLKTKPGKLMTAEEYAEGFEQMKKEAAPFLQYLITHDSENLPRELRGENNYRSGIPLAFKRPARVMSGQSDPV